MALAPHMRAGAGGEGRPPQVTAFMPELQEDELRRWGVVLPQHTFEDKNLAGIAPGTGSDGGAHPKKQPPGAWPECGLAS